MGLKKLGVKFIPILLLERLYTIDELLENGL